MAELSPRAQSVDFQLKFLQLPEPVGYWRITPSPNHTQFAVYKRLNRFHRFMTTLLLGWKWQPVRPISEESFDA